MLHSGFSFSFPFNDVLSGFESDSSSLDWSDSESLTFACVSARCARSNAPSGRLDRSEDFGLNKMSEYEDEPDRFQGISSRY